MLVTRVFLQRWSLSIPGMDIINGFDEIPHRASPPPLIRSMPYMPILVDQSPLVDMSQQWTDRSPNRPDLPRELS